VNIVGSQALKAKTRTLWDAPLLRSHWAALVIALANSVVAVSIYQTVGWHYIRGYNEVTNFLIFPPILALAVANLAAGIVFLFIGSVNSQRCHPAATACLFVCSLTVALSLLVAPPIGQTLNRKLLLATPLIEAARYGDAAVVTAKLDHGADLIVRHESLGITPLHCMASLGKSEVVELLLRKGADPNAQASFSKDTPLFFAVRDHADIPTIQLLVKYGADPALANADGQSPISYANLMAEPECSQILAIFGTGPVREAPQSAVR
jgi:hypothetical protein